SAATTLNRNAAALARFELHFPKGAVDSSGARFPGLHGDTLVVVLDVSGAFLPSAAGSENEVVLPELSGERFDELVVKTADCLLLNARRRWPRIRHLALSIDGSHHYEHWEGVHSLKNVGGMGAPGDSQETSAPKK
ncbi:MAG TPA: hypothetical protein VFR10_10585, partial [bacterium]|nr:hypothetical protein [bacterium]